MLTNVFVVLRGSIVAQMISFAVLPLLARLYAPEDFGHYQVFLTVLMFLVLSASLRYEMGILSAETEEIAFALASLCTLINVALTILSAATCALLYFIWPGTIARLGTGVWLLPVALLAAGSLQTVGYLLVRAHSFSIGSNAKGVQALGTSAFAYGLGILEFRSMGLVIGDVVGRLMALVFALRKMVATDAFYRLHLPKFQLMHQVAKRYREYPLVSLPGSLLDAVGGSLATVLMFGVFGAAMSGQYSLVERSIITPVAVIAQAVSQAYLAALSSAMRGNRIDCYALFRRIVTAHIWLGLVPAVAVFVFGRAAFEWLFGHQWTAAGRFAQIMAPMVLVSFVSIPVNMTLLIIGKQRLQFLWYTGRVALVTVSWLGIIAFKATPFAAAKIQVALTVGGHVVLLAMIGWQLSRLELTRVKTESIVCE